MLGRALGPHYVVTAPRMPAPTKPRYQTWARRIGKLLAATANPIVVGHSFGASVLLKYFAEVVPRPTVAGLFLVATPFWSSKFPEFALPADFSVRLSDLSPLYFYWSRDDTEVPLEHLEHYRRALPHAILRIVDGRGHEFDQREFPELTTDIQRVDQE
jgi:predicted alpha/beta hydrolase family esterase